jgi:hypothetical protein
VKRYDPAKDPDPKEWLAMDEARRIDIVSSYHRRFDHRVPRPRGHAMIHVIVENQLAAPEPAVVATLARLQREGLDRHDAVHAIGSVLLAHLNERMKQPETTFEGDPNAAYFTSLEKLTAAGWLAGE